MTFGFLEVLIPVLIAGASGIFAVHSRLNTRIDDTGSRLDQIELRLAEKYVPRVELAESLKSVESHMVRIEDKLDKLVLHGADVEKKVLAYLPQVLAQYKINGV